MALHAAAIAADFGFTDSTSRADWRRCASPADP
jgi:hypothetical protein